MSKETFDAGAPASLDTHQGGHKKEIKIMNEQEAEKFIEEGTTREWVSVDTLKRSTPESCIDGRGKRGVIGIPGGNAGEFLLTLASSEKASGKLISESDMPKILQRYIDVFGKFAMHTDEHALHNIGLKTDQDLKNPWPSKQEALAQLLEKPEAIGCGHIKLMLKKSEEYEVRPELVKSFLQAFYKELWRGNSELELDILRGEHEERAVVIAKVDAPKGGLNKETRIPTIIPNQGNIQAFIYHPQVTDYMRDESAESAEEITGLQIDAAQYKKIIKELGDKQLKLTVSELAGHLPTIEVNFHDDGSFETKLINSGKK